MDDDCITSGHQMNARFNPGLAMFERAPGVAIDPAQEGAADASLDAVKAAGEIGWGDMGTRSGHAAMVPWRDMAVCR